MIEFGPNGWFGVISDSINFENISIVAQAVADYINDEYRDENSSVILGYDTRFLSREYAWQVQRVLTGNGIKVFMHKTPVPTPLLAYSALLYNVRLGIMVTGGGRPARYSGLVFRNSKGLPVSRQWMSKLFNHLYRRYPRWAEENRKLLNYVDVFDRYCNTIETIIDFDMIRSIKPFVVCDSFFGSTGGYLSSLLRKKGIECISIREKPNPGFGDSVPLPNEKNMSVISRIAKENDGSIGFFFNGDGSQLGVVKAGGSYIDFSLFSCMIFDEWINLGRKDLIVFTGMTTPQRAFPMIEYYGFNHEAVCDLADREQALSNEWVEWKDFSMAFGSCFPGSDAVLQGLLLLNGICRHKLNWNEWIEEINTITGIRYVDFKTIGMKKATWEQKYRSILEEGFSPGSGKSIIGIEEHEAIKLYFNDNTWVVFDYQEQDEVINIMIDCGWQQNHTDIMHGIIQWLHSN